MYNVNTGPDVVVVNSPPASMEPKPIDFSMTHNSWRRQQAPGAPVASSGSGWGNGAGLPANGANLSSSASGPSRMGASGGGHVEYPLANTSGKFSSSSSGRYPAPQPATIGIPPTVPQPQPHSGAGPPPVPRVGSKRDYSRAPLPDPRPDFPIRYSDAFISYSRRDDAPMAQALEEALGMQGLRCVHDAQPVGPDGAFANTVHQQQVSSAIEGGDCFVCVCSPGFFGSAACLSELEHAHWLGKNVIAVQPGLVSIHQAAASPGVNRNAAESAMKILSHEEIIVIPQDHSGDAYAKAVQKLSHAIRPIGKSVVEPDANTPIKQLDVMISYRRKQTEEMKVVSKLLEERGLSYWVDVNAENGILKGVQWGKAIAGAIKGASVMLVLLSKDWLESTYCIDEFEYAMAQSKRIVVVELEAIPEMADEPPAEATPHQQTFYRRQRMCLADINTWQKITFPTLLGLTEAALPAAKANPAFARSADEMEEALRFDAEVARLHTQLTLRADKYKEALGFDVQQRWLEPKVDISTIPKDNLIRAHAYLLGGFALDEALVWMKKEGYDMEDRTLLGRLVRGVTCCLRPRPKALGVEIRKSKDSRMKPTVEHQVLVRHSVRSAQRAMRLRALAAILIAALLLAGLVAAIVMAIIAQRQKQEADRATEEALRQKEEAERQRRIADVQTAAAQAATFEAQRNYREASARATVAAALSSAGSNPEAAMLFGLEAISQAALTGVATLSNGAQATLRGILEGASGDFLATGANAAARRALSAATSTVDTSTLAEFVSSSGLSNTQTFTAFSPSGEYSVVMVAGVVSPTGGSTLQTTGVQFAVTPSDTFQLKLMGHVLDKAGGVAFAFRDVLTGPTNKTSFWPAYLSATRVLLDDNGDVWVHVRRLGRERTVCPKSPPIYFDTSCMPRTTGVLLLYSLQRPTQRGCLNLADGARFTLDVYDVFVGGGFVAALVADSPHGYRGWNEKENTWNGMFDTNPAGASKRKRAFIDRFKTYVRVYRGKPTYADAPASYKAYLPNTADACHYTAAAWTSADLHADDHYDNVDLPGTPFSRNSFVEYPDPQGFAFATTGCTDSGGTPYLVVVSYPRLFFVPRARLEQASATAADIEGGTKSIAMAKDCLVSTNSQECLLGANLGRYFEENYRTSSFSAAPTYYFKGLFANFMVAILQYFVGISSASVHSDCSYVAGVLQIDRVFEPHDRPTQATYFLFGVPVANPVGSSAMATRTTFGNVEGGSLASLTPMVPYTKLNWTDVPEAAYDSFPFALRQNPTFRGEDRSNIHARDPDLIVLGIVKLTADATMVDPRDVGAAGGIGALLLRKGVGSQTADGVCVRNQLVLFTLHPSSTPFSWRRIAELPCSEAFHGSQTDMLRKAAAVRLMVSGDSTFAAVGMPAGKVVFYDIRSHNELSLAPTVEASQLGGTIRSVATANDGKSVVIGDEFGAFVRVYPQGGSSGAPLQKQLWLYDGSLAPPGQTSWLYNLPLLNSLRASGEYDAFGPNTGFFVSSSGSNGVCHFIMAAQIKGAYWDVDSTGGQPLVSVVGFSTVANRLHLTQVYKGTALKTFQHTLDRTQRITGFAELCPECQDEAKGWRFLGPHAPTGTLMGLTGAGGGLFEGDGKQCTHPAKLRVARTWAWRTDDAALPWNPASTAAAGITVSSPFAPFAASIAEFRGEWFGATAASAAYLGAAKGPTGGTLGAHSNYFPHPSDPVEPMAFSADGKWAALAGVIYATDGGVPDPARTAAVFQLRPALRDAVLPKVVQQNSVTLSYVHITGNEHAAAFSPDGSLCAFCFSLHAVSLAGKKVWTDFRAVSLGIPSLPIGDYVTGAPEGEAKGFETVLIVLVAKDAAGAWTAISSVAPTLAGSPVRTCRKLSFWTSQRAVVADLRSTLAVFPYSSASALLDAASVALLPLSTAYVIPDLVLPNPEDDPRVDPAGTIFNNRYRTQYWSDQRASQDQYGVNWADGRYRAARNTRDGPSYEDGSFYVSRDGATLWRVDSRGAHAFQSLASARAAAADVALRFRPYTPRLSRSGRFAAVWQSATYIKLVDLEKGANATDLAVTVPVDARYIDRAGVLPAVPIPSDDGKYLALRYRDAQGEFAVRLMDVSQEELVRRACGAASRTFDDDELRAAYGSSAASSAAGQGQRAACAGYPSATRKRTYAALTPRAPAAPLLKLYTNTGKAGKEMVAIAINVNSGDEVPHVGSITCTGGGATFTKPDVPVRFSDAQFFYELAPKQQYLFNLLPTDVAAEARFTELTAGTSYSCEATLTSAAGTSAKSSTASATTQAAGYEALPGVTGPTPMIF